MESSMDWIDRNSLFSKSVDGFWRVLYEIAQAGFGKPESGGARVELARKDLGMKQKELLAQLQVNGVDMNASGLSKLEGQIRYVTDFELAALSRILNVSVDWLLGLTDD